MNETIRWFDVEAFVEDLKAQDERNVERVGYGSTAFRKESILSTLQKYIGDGTAIGKEHTLVADAAEFDTELEHTINMCAKYSQVTGSPCYDAVYCDTVESILQRIAKPYNEWYEGYAEWFGPEDQGAYVSKANNDAFVYDGDNALSISCGYERRVYKTLREAIEGVNWWPSHIEFYNLTDTEKEEAERIVKELLADVDFCDRFKCSCCSKDELDSLSLIFKDTTKELKETTIMSFANNLYDKNSIYEEFHSFLAMNLLGGLITKDEATSALDNFGVWLKTAKPGDTYSWEEITFCCKELQGQ